jgi:hypothetical protein
MSSVKRVSGDYTIESIGTTDVVNLNSSFVNINGNLTVSGNAVLVGNISADKIFNGTTSIEIPVTSGNAIITIGGTANVAVFSPTGQYVDGEVSATGNIDGGNVNTTGLVSATGNINGGNINVDTGNIVLIQTSGATTNQTIRFQDANTAVTTVGSNVGSIEWFTSDATGVGPRVAAKIRAVYEDTNGNTNIQIQTDSSGSLTTRVTVIGSTGYVGIGNALPADNLAVTGSTYISGALTSAATVTGNNAVVTNQTQTANLVVTGNITTPSWTIAGVGIRTVAAVYTDSSTAALGTAVNNHIHVLAEPTLAGTNVSVTTTNASTLYIHDAPVAGPNMTITNRYALFIASGNTYSAGNILSIANVRGGNINSDASVCATGNITGANIVGVQNVYTTGNVITGNINVSTQMSGTGIGVENIVWQNTTAIMTSTSMANVGILGFLALAGQSYKFEVYMPVIPVGSTTTGFSTYFDAGTCYYTVEAQTTETSAYTTGTSNVSGVAPLTQGMTGLTPRAVKITGTIYSAGNSNVAIQAQTASNNIGVQSGAYLTYTRIG